MAQLWLNQTESEFSLLLDLLRPRGVRRLLEIGSESGGSFLRLMSIIDPGKMGMGMAVSVSLSSPNLNLFQEWAPDGVTVFAREADSHDLSVIAWADAIGRPYDFIHIDGDHTYDGARRDWVAYGLGCSGEGTVVALHDIVPDAERGEPMGCVQLWREIVAEGYKTLEIIAPQAHWNGIGVVYL